VDNQMILMHMDLKGFAISTGSACTAGNVDPSHVLIAMYGENSPYIRESIRISFGLGNTQEEVETFAHQLSASVKRLQKKAFTNNKDSQS
ncbi:aminotransferase class V-fold PLP-dependent enzyme, partial [Enterococcus camelliae]